MLQVRELSVNYGVVSALKRVNISIEAKKIVTLIGANGAGKSTFLKAVCGIVPKASGEVIFMGKDISNEKTHKIIRNGICMVPEGRRIFPGLSVEENLIVGSVSNEKRTKAELNEKLEECYKLFPRLNERRGQVAGSLSGGEQQMLAVGRALMGRPKLMMLDEPSLGLAPKLVDEIFETITKIHKSGTTILLIEQNANMSLQISDYVYVLENGSVVLEGKGTEMLQNEDIKHAYLGG